MPNFPSASHLRAVDDLSGFQARGTIAFTQRRHGFNLKRLHDAVHVDLPLRAVQSTGYSYRLAMARLQTSLGERLEAAVMVPSKTRLYVVTLGKGLFDQVNVMLEEVTPVDETYVWEARSRLKQGIVAAFESRKLIENRYPDKLPLSDFRAPYLGRLLDDGTLFILDKPAEQLEAEDAMSPHPGALLREFTLAAHGLTAEDLRARGIEQIDALLAEQVEFDEAMRQALRPIIGGEADLMAGLQQVYNYERRTGLPHSGRWLDGPNGTYILAPK